MNSRLVIPLLMLMLAGAALLGVTCRHEVVTPEPIKIEVTIRQEIHQYTHQVNDAVAGKASVDETVDALFPEEEPAGDGNSLLHEIEGLFIPTAYAAEGDGSARERFRAALQSRKDRHATIQQYLKEGSAGENHDALLSFRASNKTQANAEYAQQVKNTINQENADRETIIAIIASRKGVAVSIVREEQFTANVNAAPAGAWIEVKQGESWIWSKKQ
ncbi:MAG: DUF1318 domain-containing protein [Verrucomicrobia bacterium]|nr:DUF1318 domain-containing protein [Verrucomicrobiota bacterium]